MRHVFRRVVSSSSMCFIKLQIKKKKRQHCGALLYIAIPLVTCNFVNRFFVLIVHPIATGQLQLANNEQCVGWAPIPARETRGPTKKVPHSLRKAARDKSYKLKILRSCSTHTYLYLARRRRRITHKTKNTSNSYSSVCMLGNNNN